MKIQKLAKTQGISTPGIQQIIDNIFLSYNLLVEWLRLHYVSLFFAKRNS